MGGKGAITLRILVVASSSVLGCQAFFGVEEDPAATGVATGAGAATGTTSTGHPGDGGAGAGGEGSGRAPCACVGAPSPEWSGPFSITTTDGSVTSLECAGGQPAITRYEGTPAAHTCTPCTCGPSSGACAANPLLCYANSGCNGSFAVGTGKDGCELVVGNVQSCWIGNPTFVPGSCRASGGAIASKPSWTTAHHLCVLDPSAGDCAEGEACVSGKACIFRESHAECPPGFPEQLLVWGAATDTRECSPCVCSPPAGTCAGGGYELASAPFSCSVSPTYGPQVCASFDGPVTVYANLKSATPMPQPCTASGGDAIGAFTKVGAATICCTPD